MKLFAIAATTATGYRVVTPAPGFINEQGGYWADQTADQSRQYPQPPQNSYQRPQVYQPRFQKPQCCGAYEYTLSSGEKVWMVRDGKESAGMDVWKGSHNGEDIVIYYEYTGAHQHGSPYVEANWLMGTKVGDPNATQIGTYIYEHRYCPHEWQSTHQLECRQQPSQPQPVPDPVCCDKYVSTGLRAFFTKQGEHQGKPYYSGLMNNGVSIKKLFWRFDNVPDNRPREAVPGTWCFHDDFDSHGASVSSKSLGDQSECPVGELVEWTFPLDLKCASNQAVMTCETKHDNEPFNDIFNGHGETLPAECKVERVMYDLVRVQAQQVAELADSFQLKDAFNQAVVAYEKLLRNDCGFVGTNGYAPDCGSICGNIKEIQNMNEFAPVLNQFVDFSRIFFAISDEKKTECVGYQNELFSHVAKFQEHVGTLFNLPAEFQN